MSKPNAASGTEYPMFVFSQSRSSEACPIPNIYPSVDISYAQYTDSADDDLECEEFEIL